MTSELRTHKSGYHGEFQAEDGTWWTIHFFNSRVQEYVVRVPQVNGDVGFLNIDNLEKVEAMPHRWAKIGRWYTASLRSGGKALYVRSEGEGWVRMLSASSYAVGGGKLVTREWAKKHLTLGAVCRDQERVERHFQDSFAN